MGKLTIPVFGADARTAFLGRPPAGDTRLFGESIGNHWKTMYFLQPRPARAPSGPGPLRRHLGKMMVIQNLGKPLQNLSFPVPPRTPKLQRPGVLQLGTSDSSENSLGIIGIPCVSCDPGRFAVSLQPCARKNAAAGIWS